MKAEEAAQPMDALLAEGEAGASAAASALAIRCVEPSVGRRYVARFVDESQLFLKWNGYKNAPASQRTTAIPTRRCDVDGACRPEGRQAFFFPDWVESQQGRAGSSGATEASSVCRRTSSGIPVTGRHLAGTPRQLTGGWRSLSRSALSGKTSAADARPSPHAAPLFPQVKDVSLRDIMDMPIQSVIMT
jgi:hypothetical protein